MKLFVLLLFLLPLQLRAEPPQETHEPFAYTTLYGITVEANRYAQYQLQNMHKVTQYIFYLTVFIMLIVLGITMSIMPHAWQTIWAKLPSILVILMLSVMLAPTIFNSMVYTPVRSLFFAIPEWVSVSKSESGQGLFAFYERLGNAIGVIVELADNAARIADENEHHYPLFLAVSLLITYLALFITSAGSWIVMCIILHVILLLLPLALAMAMLKPLRFISVGAAKALLACMVFSVVTPFMMELSLWLLENITPHAKLLLTSPLASGLPLHFVVMSMFVGILCISMHRASFKIARYVTTVSPSFSFMSTSSASSTITSQRAISLSTTAIHHLQNLMHHSTQWMGTRTSLPLALPWMEKFLRRKNNPPTRTRN